MIKKLGKRKSRDPLVCLGVTLFEAFTETFSASIFSIKVINVNTKIMSEICSKFTIKKPEWRHWCHSGVYIVNFEQISHITVDFEQVTLSYIMLKKWLKIHTAIGHFSTLCMKELLPAGFNPFKNHALSFWIIVYQ